MQRDVRKRRFSEVKVKRIAFNNQGRIRSFEHSNKTIQSSKITISTNNKITHSQAKLCPPILSEANDSYPKNESKMVSTIQTNSAVFPHVIRYHSLNNQAKFSSVKSPDVLEQHSSQSYTAIHSTKSKNIISSVIDDDHREVQPKEYLKNIKSSPPTIQIGAQRRSKSHVINIWLNRSISIHEDREEAKRKRRRRGCFGWFCCCSCPCCLLCIFGTLLLGTAIAAILIALLIKPNTKTTAILITTSPSTTATSATSTSTTSTATSTTETSTSATSSTTTTTTVSIPLITYGLVSNNDTVIGIWNTTAGGVSSLSTVGVDVGDYYTGEVPTNAFDNNTNTKYTNFGYCNGSGSSYRECGQNTGLYVIPQHGASLLLAIQFCTGNDQPARDPLTATIEGSNGTSSTLTLGSSWTLIYNGSTGLDTDPGRKACGTILYILSNYIAYLSYRILVTSQRAFDEAIQYSEIRLLG